MYKIITNHDYPPIPIRDFDWSAVMEEYEPGDLVGTGKTEQESILDLVDALLDSELLDDTSRILLSCENSVGWIKYKGKTYFAQPNYPETERRGKPIIDLSYCATASMNGLVLKSVVYRKSAFEKETFTKSHTNH